MLANAAMVNVLGQHSPQSVTPSSARDSDGDRLDSPQDAWSGADSGGEEAEQDGSRKRKRPMSVS